MSTWVHRTDPKPKQAPGRDHVSKKQVGSLGRRLSRQSDRCVSNNRSLFLTPTWNTEGSGADLCFRHCCDGREIESACEQLSNRWETLPQKTVERELALQVWVPAPPVVTVNLLDQTGTVFILFWPQGESLLIIAAALDQLSQWTRTGLGKVRWL